MSLEVGTVPVQQVLQALRGDAGLHAYGRFGTPDSARDADDWKGMVARQSLLACRQALKGLQVA